MSIWGGFGGKLPKYHGSPRRALEREENATHYESEQPRSPLSVALRVSADPWALEGPFGGVPRSQMMKFVNFINIENINRSASGITPEHPW